MNVELAFKGPNHSAETPTELDCVLINQSQFRARPEAHLL